MDVVAMLSGAAAAGGGKGVGIEAAISEEDAGDMSADHPVEGAEEAEDQDGARRADASCFQSFFTEGPIVLQLIDDLRTNFERGVDNASTARRICEIVQKYQEQSHLLDPHLETFVSRLTALVRPFSVVSWQLHALAQCIYVVAKVRGPKIVLRFFPHEVSDLQPVFSLLRRQDPRAHDVWEVRYVLLLWLCMLVRVPFDLTTVLEEDNVVQQQQQHSQSQRLHRPEVDAGTLPPAPAVPASLVDALLEAARSYLADTGKCRDAAALLIAQLLTRPDLKDACLGEFLSWSARTLSLTPAPNVHLAHSFVVTGVLQALCNIFKIGQRGDLLTQYLGAAEGPVLDVGRILSFSDSANSVQRKLSVKLAQRLALSMLKPHVFSWRYERGSRNLLDNLTGAGDGGRGSSAAGPDSEAAMGRRQKSDVAQWQAGPEAGAEEMDVEDFDVPELLEDIVHRLLLGLKDRDTIVRWSAAKGCGRICGRLPKALADDIYQSILELLDDTETDTAWHGGCLAVAELSRRGLLLPQRLRQTIPLVTKSALFYDIQRGSYSVGSHVRDAACYVCWSFARAYSPEVLAPFVADLSHSLLVASCFDREINCRRAASAAFQEFVGRCPGAFPHGIDILTKADYFTLANRTNAYLEVAAGQIGAVPEYRRSLIQHLATVKIFHWEASLRELAAQTLGRFCLLDPSFFLLEVLPSILLPRVLDAELSVRHGALLAVGWVVEGLSSCGYGLELETSASVALRSSVGRIIVDLDHQRLYRGKGGELMRQAACNFIACCARARMPYPDSVQLSSNVGNRVIKVQPLQKVKESLYEGIRHPNEAISAAGARSLGAFCEAYYAADVTAGRDEAARATLTQLLAWLEAKDAPASRRGAALALGSLPPFMFREREFEVVQALSSAIATEEIESQRDAETRRNAVRALGQIASQLADAESPALACRAFAGISVGFQDYAVDKRGDIGSWVREAAIEAIHLLSARMVELGHFSTETHGHSLVGMLLQQAVEKIDRTRAMAGGVLQRVVQEERFFFPCAGEIAACGLREAVLDVRDWSSAAASYSVLVQFLQFADYRKHLLLGLVVAVGGLTEHVSRHSAQALLAHMGRIPNGDAVLSDALVELATEHEKDDRVMAPLLKTVDVLFVHHKFASLDEGRLLQLLEMCKTQLARSRDVAKILTVVKILSSLVVVSSMALHLRVREKAIQQLLVVLANRFPKVRRVASEEVYSLLITHDECFSATVSEDFMAEAMDVLSSTPWDGSDPEVVRSARDELFRLLAVEKPTLKASSAGSSASSRRAGDSSSYADLVKETGY